MTNGEFRTWLAGFFELSGADAPLTRHQLYIIGNHLNLAEAVEGALDPFNTDLRESIQVQIGLLSGPDESADPEFVANIFAKVMAKAAA